MSRRRRRTGVLAGALSLVVSLAVTTVLVGPARAADPIVSVSPPVVTGTAAVGEQLRTSRGSWTPSGLTFTFQWLRDGAPIDGATHQRYRVRVDDLDATLSAAVTAADGTGQTLTATSDPTGRVGPGTIEGVRPPEVSGTARYAHRLTATAGTWSPKPERVRYHWLRGGQPIAGARRAAYVLAPEDVGLRISVEVTVAHEGYRVSKARSAPTRRVGQRVPLRRTVTYHVETRGHVTASLKDFKRLAQETYDDPRGWLGAGMGFRRVATGGAFTLVLAEASYVPRFSSACSAEWSCRVGRFVIINQTRWLHASPAWHAGGRSLRDYRNMVVNHETGHWLGHGHLTCPAPGHLAPVMMQQSKGTHGCRLNPWPLPSELWAHPSGKRPAAGSAWEPRVWVG